MRSTSIHTLNADKGLNFFEKFAYLILNFLNNCLPYFNVDKRIEFRKFAPQNLWNEWANTFPASSAARKHSDLFWRTLPWREIEKELGEIHVFDTGCGHGNYSLRLWEEIRSYTGVDAKRRDNWKVLESDHQNFHFIESNSTDILPLIPKQTNLFITQSAIEHFDKDLRYFEQLKQFIDQSAQPIIQIHLFPAGATLPLYLFHGLRQYTPRTISKITRIFGNVKAVYLYPLGGRNSFWLHFKYFTWPVLILRKYSKPTFDVDDYEKQLREAVILDQKVEIKSPLFWALVIKSNVEDSKW